MIIRRIKSINNTDYNYIYSDSNHYIVDENQTYYESVYDPIDIQKIYIESDREIKISESTEEE